MFSKNKVLTNVDGRFFMFCFFSPKEKQVRLFFFIHPVFLYSAPETKKLFRQQALTHTGNRKRERDADFSSYAASKRHAEINSEPDLRWAGAQGLSRAGCAYTIR